MKKNNRARGIGDVGEDYVADYLKERGYAIVTQNYSSQYGEVDIIATKAETICFIEVKTRKLNSQVSGEYAITGRKQKRIIMTSLLYLQEYPSSMTMRFDAAVVTRDVSGNIVNCEYYEAAFDGSAYE